MPTPPAARQGGKTFFELLSTLSILFIITAMAVPSMMQFVERNRANATISELRTLFVYARETAVRHNCITVICPSDDGISCSSNQKAPLVVFSDHNNNRAIDLAENDQLYRQAAPLADDSRLQWAFFQNKKYLEMTPSGYTNHQNGTLIYCPPSGDEKHARILIVHKSGRVRFGVDSDGDGIINRAGGKNVEC